MTRIDGKPESKIKISDDVLAVIVGLAIRDVKDVYAAPFGKNKSGVEIRLEDGVAVCDLYMAVNYGARIPMIAKVIQERVRTAVENMAGLKVSAVNLNIVDIKF